MMERNERKGEDIIPLTSIIIKQWNHIDAVDEVLVGQRLTHHRSNSDNHDHNRRAEE